MAFLKLTVLLLAVATCGVLSSPLSLNAKTIELNAPKLQGASITTDSNPVRNQRAPLSLNADTIKLNDPTLTGPSINTQDPKVVAEAVHPSRSTSDPASPDLETAETFLIGLGGWGGYGGYGYGGGYGGYGYGGGYPGYGYGGGYPYYGRFWG